MHEPGLLMKKNESFSPSKDKSRVFLISAPTYKVLEIFPPFLSNKNKTKQNKAEQTKLKTQNSQDRYHPNSGETRTF